MFKCLETIYQYFFFLLQVSFTMKFLSATNQRLVQYPDEFLTIFSILHVSQTQFLLKNEEVRNVISDENNQGHHDELYTFLS